MSISNNSNQLFTLEKIYLKDVSVEVPKAPKIFLNKGQPNIDLSLNFFFEPMDGSYFQVILNVEVNARLEDESMLLIVVDQAGIFQMQNIDDAQAELLKNIECPNLIFPFVREVIADLSTKAGFVPILLEPVNFAYLYQQKQNVQNNTDSRIIN